MTKKQIIAWLNEGDISIRYQVNRDLLGGRQTDAKATLSYLMNGRNLKFTCCYLNKDNNRQNSIRGNDTWLLLPR